MFRLDRPQASVEAAFFDKLLVLSHFQNSARLNHGDCICFANGRKPVRHNNARSTCQQMIEGELDLFFRCGIDTGGRLIQHQDWRIFQKSPRD